MPAMVSLASRSVTFSPIGYSPVIRSLGDDANAAAVGVKFFDIEYGKTILSEDLINSVERQVWRNVRDIWCQTAHCQSVA